MQTLKKIVHFVQILSNQIISLTSSQYTALVARTKEKKSANQFEKLSFHGVHQFTRELTTPYLLQRGNNIKC